MGRDNNRPGLSADDLRAIDAITAANNATNAALAVLSRAAAPQSDKPQAKRSRRKVTKIIQGADGELTVEYSDGSTKRLHVARDGNGNLVAEELALPAESALSPAADAGPPLEDEPAPGGMFAGVFGSLEGT